MVHDAGDAIILPGLINAHTHLELSDCQCGDPPDEFAQWLLSLPRRVGAGSADPPEKRFADAVRRGVDASLRFGVTAVGDISQQMHITRPLLQGGPLRCVSYGEVIGLAQRMTRFNELLPRATDRSHESGRLRIGLSPHAPYTVDLPSYRRCVAMAREHRLPLATHLAESPHEREFLQHRSGPFREMWESLGSWSDDVQTFSGGPIDFAASVGLLDEATLLAHVNYCGDRELDLLSRGQASVVYCPRTHRYFGHPPHRWRDMRARGVNVAIGTDSCASSPDLDVLEELRLLRQLAPEQTADALWELVTLRAARAIRSDQVIGSITPGKAADFAVFQTTSDQPLENLLERRVQPREVWMDGRLIAGSSRPASPD